MCSMAIVNRLADAGVAGADMGRTTFVGGARAGHDATVAGAAATAAAAGQDRAAAEAAAIAAALATRKSFPDDASATDPLDLEGDPRIKQAIQAAEASMAAGAAAAEASFTINVHSISAAFDAALVTAIDAYDQSLAKFRWLTNQLSKRPISLRRVPSGKRD